MRNSAATMRSWRKNLRNSWRGSVVQAMESVMAVKIQLSSPRGVRLSWRRPGSFLARSGEMLVLRGFWRTKNHRAISMGVVRQAVKRSAGRRGFVGRFSWTLQAARWM